MYVALTVATRILSYTCIISVFNLAMNCVTPPAIASTLLGIIYAFAFVCILGSVLVYKYLENPLVPNSIAAGIGLAATLVFQRDTSQLTPVNPFTPQNKKKSDFLYNSETGAGLSTQIITSNEKNVI